MGTCINTGGGAWWKRPNPSPRRRRRKRRKINFVSLSQIVQHQDYVFGYQGNWGRAEGA